LGHEHSGGLYSTTHDLLKWEQGLFGGGLLRPASLTLLTTPVRDQYAFGVFAVEAGGNTTIAHSGGLDGFNTYMAYDPDRHMTVIVLGNINGPAPDLLGGSLLALARDDTAAGMNGRRTASVSSEALQTYAGVYDLEPTLVFTVSVTSGKLMAQATGQTAFELHPEAADAFSGLESGSRVIFTRDASGAVAGLILHQDGRDGIAQKQ